MQRFIFFLMIFACALSIASPVLACDPPPTQNSLDCADLGSGYGFGFRVQGARDGTYRLTAHNGLLVGGAPQDSRNHVTISKSSGRSFNWSASLGIDAVIIFAGSNPSVYKLHEEKEGQNFHGQMESRHKSYPVEKVLFCYDYELGVSAEAQGTGSSTSAWSITKAVDTAEQTRFAGETAVFTYTVAVKKVAGVETGFAVASRVKIKNDTPLKATITALKSYLLPNRVRVNLSCGDLHLPFSLNPGKEVLCTATTPLNSRVNGSLSISVRTSGKVGGAKDENPITWSGGAGTGNTGVGTVTVTDTNQAFGGPYPTTADKTWTYPVTLACPTDPAVYHDGATTVALNNTAALRETGQQASQAVTLHCYAPVVTSASATTVERQYFWGITKTSPVTQLVLDKTEMAAVPYVVGVSVTGTEERNYQVAGTVTIANPDPASAMTVTLTGEIAPGVPTAFAGCANPLVIPPGDSVTCSYQAGVEEKISGTNVAQVVLNDIAFSTTASYDFANAQVKAVDGCVTVTDDALAGPLGIVCVDQAPGQFNYTLQVGPYPNSECNARTSYVNTAAFITNDTQTEGFANWTVDITIKCAGGSNCTFTPAYWAAHADKSSPETYKTTWDQIQPGGPSSPFFTSGSTWLQILLLDPAGSPYLALAQDYIAADLNLLKGASATDNFRATVAHAAALLEQYAAAQSAIPLEDASETTDLLHMYNNGITGPGICPECAP